MKNKDILSIYPGLSRLRGRTDFTPPVAVSYSIIHNIKILEPIVESIEQARRDIIDRYMIPIEDDPNVFIPKDGYKEIVEKELEELGNVENDISLVMIPIQMIENMNISLADMEVLYPIIEE